MPKTKTQDFQIPADTLASQKIPLAEPNFINPTTAAEMPVNQIANQGLAPAKNIPSQNAPANSAKNQASVFGKSELLNANQILNQMLGLKTGHRVADLGAGGGLFTLQAARLVGSQGEVYAVDIMKTILSDIESKSRMASLYNIKTIWSNIEILGATKIPEATLDFVFLVNILFQSKSIDKMLSEAARLMKNGGKMLVIDWNDNNAKVGPHNDRRLDPNNIITQAEKINLVLEQQFMAGQYHFGLIFIKQ
jgi:predicted methyltransferase